MNFLNYDEDEIPIRVTKVSVFTSILDLETKNEFFKLRDIDRDHVLWWMNKITGLNYNVCRSDPENSSSSMILCLGDIIIMEDN